MAARKMGSYKNCPNSEYPCTHNRPTFVVPKTLPLDVAQLYALRFGA